MRRARSARSTRTLNDCSVGSAELRHQCPSQGHESTGDHCLSTARTRSTCSSPTGSPTACRFHNWRLWAGRPTSSRGAGRILFFCCRFCRPRPVAFAAGGHSVGVRHLAGQRRLTFEVRSCATRKRVATPIIPPSISMRPGRRERSNGARTGGPRTDDACSVGRITSGRRHLSGRLVVLATGRGGSERRAHECRGKQVRQDRRDGHTDAGETHRHRHSPGPCRPLAAGLAPSLGPARGGQHGEIAA